MALKILFFGKLADLTGLQETDFPDHSEVAALRISLIGMYPLLSEMKFVVAVNRKTAVESTSLGPGDEIALMPPFSGG